MTQNSIGIFALLLSTIALSGCFGYQPSYSPCPPGVKYGIEMDDPLEPVAIVLPEPRTVDVFGSFQVVFLKDGEEVTPPSNVTGDIDWDIGVYSVPRSGFANILDNFSIADTTDVTLNHGKIEAYLGRTSGGAIGCEGCNDPHDRLMTCASIDRDPKLVLSDGRTAKLTELKLKEGRPDRVNTDILGLDLYGFPLQLVGTFTVEE